MREREERERERESLCVSVCVCVDRWAPCVCVRICLSVSAIELVWTRAFDHAAGCVRCVHRTLWGCVCTHPVDHPQLPAPLVAPSPLVD